MVPKGSTIPAGNQVKLPSTTIPLPHLPMLLPKLHTFTQDALLAGLAVCGIAVLWLVAFLLLRGMNARRLFTQKAVFLELIPLAFTDSSLLAMEQLFTTIHGFKDTRSWLGKRLRQDVSVSLETVGNRAGGVRFIISVPQSKRETIERKAASHPTELKLQEVPDYLPSGKVIPGARFLEFKELNRYHPLRKQMDLTHDDPEAYLIWALANLKPEELIALQFVISPTSIKDADATAERILKNDFRLDGLHKKRRPSAKPVFDGLKHLLMGVADLIGELVGGQVTHTPSSSQSTTTYNQQAAMGLRPVRSIGSLEQEAIKPINEKVNGLLFRVSIRAVVITPDSRRRAANAENIRTSFNVYKTKYQAITSRMDFPYRVKGAYRLFMYRHRLPAVFESHSIILDASEVASLYHLPSSETGRNANLTHSLSRTLETPLVMKQRADNQQFDVILGRSNHRDGTEAVGMVAKDREKHVFIIGSTGNGKTTMQEYAIVQDIRGGRGVAFLDPHGDSAKKILKYIPKERMKDVVYLNPIDIAHPVGLNFLELPSGLSEDELLLEKGRVVSAVVSVMRKVFSDDDASAYRIESVMRNAVRTALTVEGATLFTVLKLLRNEKFRKSVISKLDDEDLKDYWREEIGQAGEMQLVGMTKGVTLRLDRFSSSEPVKRMFDQEKSTINFEDIMNSGKILICNLAQGELEEDESALIGTTILAKLKMAAERRAKVPEEERRPFYLYVDEFQNFATTPFVKMLSSSRKYKLFLTIAEQSTQQQDNNRLTEAVLSNVSTVVTFRTGSHIDEELMLHRFDPFLKQGDIGNLPTYNFYMRDQAQESLEPMSGKTIVLPVEEADKKVADKVIKESRRRYTTKYVKKAATDKPKKDDSQDKSDGKKDQGKDEGNEGQQDSVDPLADNDDK